MPCKNKMPTLGSALLWRGVIARADSEERGTTVNSLGLTHVRLAPLTRIGGALATSAASWLPQAAAELIHQRNNISQLGCNSVTILACSILAAGDGCGILTPDRPNRLCYSLPRVATQGDSVIRRLAQSVAKPNRRA